ncbi:MAG: hypothetical protein U9R49_13650 [Bacteroidota bacterium]|nr:hypothetical protein [Bacteroidota bacterium]
MRRFFVKPVILLTLITSMLVVSSCQKDKDIIEADLIGTWDLGQASVDIKVGPISLIQFLKTTLQLGDQEAQDFVDQLISEYDEISGGTITFNADYSYQMLNGDLEEIGTWELDGDKLYLTISGDIPDDEPLLIESLDSSSALMTWEEDQEVDIDEDGSADFTATLIIELNLSKQ